MELIIVIIGAILSVITGIILFHYTQRLKIKQQQIPKLKEIHKRILKLQRQIAEMYEWLRCHVAKKLEPYLDQLEPIFEKEVIKDIQPYSNVEVGLSIIEKSAMKQDLIYYINKTSSKPAQTIDDLRNEFDGIVQELEYLNIPEIKKLTEDTEWFLLYELRKYQMILFQAEAVLDQKLAHNYERLFDWWADSRKDEFELSLELTYLSESLLKRIQNK